MDNLDLQSTEMMQENTCRICRYRLRLRETVTTARLDKARKKVKASKPVGRVYSAWVDWLLVCGADLYTRGIQNMTFSYFLLFLNNFKKYLDFAKMTRSLYLFTLPFAVQLTDPVQFILNNDIKFLILISMFLSKISSRRFVFFFVACFSKKTFK